ncbi:MAG TPA: hypothetical protein DCW31_11460, partial [Lactobacillus sp.]|nr:hypothetical protein [Lactobacillus sp.]
MSKQDSQNDENENIPTRKQYRRRQRRNALFNKFHLQGKQPVDSADNAEDSTVGSLTGTAAPVTSAESQSDEKSAVSVVASSTQAVESDGVASSVEKPIVAAPSSADTEESKSQQAPTESEEPVTSEKPTSQAHKTVVDQKSEAETPQSELEREGDAEEKPLHLVSSRWTNYSDSSSTSEVQRSGEEEPRPVPLEKTIASEAPMATFVEPQAAESAKGEDLGSIVENPGLEENAVSDQEQILRGTGWMTAASITSRVLGALYIIPWVIWFGTFYNQANALFSKGYNVYSIVLMISTAGIPAAISKLIAHYNALNEYGVGFRLFKRGLVLSFITGSLAAILLWLMSPMNSLTTGDPNVIPVLRSLTLAVFIFPTLAMMRGMFQGYHMMAPSAISQFVEQLVRIIYMLLTAFLIMRVGSAPAKNWPHAVAQSTFAAGLGALAGVGVLLYEMWRHRAYFRNKIEGAKDGLVISTPQLLKQIIWQAIPFTIVPSAIAIYQLFDQVTFFRIMKVTSNLSYTVQNTLYAYFDFNANKIIMITVSLASALAATTIPMLTEAHTLKNTAGTSQQINFTLELFSFI